MNVVPTHSSVTNETVPPWLSTICLTMASPRPVPSDLPWVTNGVKRRSRISSGIPAPLSVTSIDTLQRGPEIAHPLGGGVVGIIGEDVEQSAPEDVLASGHRRVRVGIADRDNRKVGEEHQIQTGSCLEIARGSPAQASTSRADSCPHSWSSRFPNCHNSRMTR